MDVLGNSLKISDNYGKTLFSADRKEVLIGADSLVVTGKKLSI